MNNNKLTLDKAALASELSISTKTLERMRDAGKLPPPLPQFGGRVIWSRDSIENWLKGNSSTTAAAKVEKKRGRKRLAI